MSELITIIVGVVLSAFVGYLVGEMVGYNRYKKQIKEINHRTSKLVDYIAQAKSEMKGGAE
jgi:membrane protein DedA with SNARE-associated domain